MFQNEPNALLRVISARLFDTAGIALPLNTVFVAGELKRVKPDGSVASAANLPTPVTGASAGSFQIQVALSEVDQLGSLRLQLTKAGVTYWEWQEEIVQQDDAPLLAASGKTVALANAWLQLLLNNVSIALIGDAGGLRSSAAAGSLYVSLHTDNPGPAGSSQLANEVSYVGYARVAVARTVGGWVVTGTSASPVAPIAFPAGTGGGPGPATYLGVGTSLSGAGLLLYSGPLASALVVGNGLTPILSTATTITEK